MRTEQQETTLNRRGIYTMPNKTPIQWTDYSSNPIYAVARDSGKRGWHCSKVSSGCAHCYAEKINKPFGTGLDYTAQNDSKVEFKLSEKECEAIRKLAIRCNKAGIRQNVFLGDMLDIFHKDISDDILNELFSGTLEICTSLTFQLLTKRIERAREYLNWRWGEGRIPSRHIQIGTSIEDQPTADRRVPELLKTRAAMRFLSVEPLLAPVNLYNYLDRPGPHDASQSISWCIVGGESGNGARPVDISWIRSIVGQCRVAGVPCFVKQLGAKPAVNYYDTGFREEYEAQGWDWPDPIDWDMRNGQPPLGSLVHIKFKNKKGGDISEFPDDLRVRQFPRVGCFIRASLRRKEFGEMKTKHFSIESC
jgi:protein gp37